MSDDASRDGRKEDVQSVERRRRDDTIELKLSDIREQLKEGSERMDGVETQLGEMQETNAIIRAHIEATCEVARAAGIIIRPLVWVATRIRTLTIWIAAFAASILGITTLGERFGWW